MLAEINLKNFKAFKNAQKIPIRPITLIYGANSSGKSSIFQALLLMKQTFKESKSQNTHLLYKGEFTDQQNYSRCIHNRDVTQDFTISLGVSGVSHNVSTGDIRFMGLSYNYNGLSEKAIKTYGLYFNINSIIKCDFNYSIFGNDTQLDSLSYSIDDINLFSLIKVSDEVKDKLLWDSPLAYVPEEFHGLIPEEYLTRDDSDATDFYWRIHQDNVGHLDFYKYDLNTISERMINVLYDCFIQYQCSEECDANRVSDYSLEDFRDDFLLVAKRTVFFVSNALPIHSETLYDLSEKTKILGKFGKESIGSLRVVSEFICGEFTRSLKTSLAHATYIGPIRVKPERFTDVIKDNFDIVGSDGEYTSAIINKNKQVLDSINKAMGKLGLDYELSVHRASGDASMAFGDIYSLQIFIRNTDTALTLCDVGFGISQILPILTQMYIQKQNTILIEQPEIHLHPKMQAELADLFIEESYKNIGPDTEDMLLYQLRSEKKLFVIETHSEHLLLRIMKRIRQTTTGTLPKGEECYALTPEEVCLIYVEKIGDESIVRLMPLNELGQLVKPWPGGFFEEGLREMF